MLQIGNMKTFAGRKMPTHLLYQSDKDFKNLNIQYLLFIINPCQKIDFSIFNLIFEQPLWFVG